MNKEKICLFYQYSSTMYYWQKWFKNKYRDYIEKSIDMERSFYLKNGTVLYFRIPADNMAGQRFDKELNGERLELLCLNYENKELHNKIDKLLKENESLRARIKTIKRLRKKQSQKKNKYKSIVIDFQKALEKKNNKIDKAIKYMEENCDILMTLNGYFIRSELTLTGLGELFKILKSKDSDVDE